MHRKHETAAARRRERGASSTRSLEDTRRVLIVDQSTTTVRLVSSALRAECRRGSVTASTLAEAKAALAEGADELLAAVVGLELPDASGAELVELCLAYELPTIVLTATWDDDVRQRIWRYDVFDYYFKGVQGLRAVCRAIDRLPRNAATKILVVDDSAAFRSAQARLLGTHHFQVLLANDGAEALPILAANPDIRLVITDYEMPEMDGVELVARIRERFPRDELAVMGVSAQGAATTSTRFLKHGANDFLPKPFEKEEYYCRVYNCVEAVERARAIKRAAYTDALTELPNRLYFFENAPAQFAAAVSRGEPVAVAMLDIDFFKRVNDTFGHAGGDAALRHVAALARRHLGELGLLARFGGEEFCVFASGHDRAAIAAAFEGLRAALEASVVPYEGAAIRLTLSTGIALRPEATLDATINRADELLYEAKGGGRNRVVLQPP